MSDHFDSENEHLRDVPELGLSYLAGHVLFVKKATPFFGKRGRVPWYRRCSTDCGKMGNMRPEPLGRVIYEAQKYKTKKVIYFTLHWSFLYSSSDVLSSRS